ncbi:MULTISPECIES: methyl-accepting chemotaxis protein [unclassified Guyparkeria]|uniref:methyl-accepting chemotaxis protein n=1 Tax=unclassified Guyparkeria TaxID=2626246 RepID=UPI0007337CA9|nr:MULTISPECIES: methyl-accepting chemotaxis protein [unclassified Guyparkeria]KTG16980.1 hypothetical protein AUR63_02725 [Guyparkeria sp. XI15]OAE86014.1 hypothetical protein AWR35_02725 [Guyparkeria sp. WRN-7]
MTIKAKLFLLMILAGLATVGTSAFGIYAELKGQDLAEKNYELRIKPIMNVEESVKLTNAITTQSLLALQHDPSGRTAAMHNHEIDVHLDVIQDGLAKLEEVNAKIAEITHRRDRSNQAQAALFATQEELTKVAFNPLLEKLEQGNYVGAQALLILTLSEVLPNFQQAAEHYEGILRTNMENELAATAERVEKDVWISSIVTVINVLIIVIIAGWIIRSVTSGLRAADRFATNLAEGNLSDTVTVDSRDEIAEIIDHMNTARDSLRNTLRHIGDASQQLASAAEETSAVSEQTDRGVARQMQEIEQVAAAMNEMTSTVEEVARNASDASQSAQSSNDSAKHGQTILGNAVNAVGILSDEIRQSSDTIDSLKAESEEIGKVLDVIGAIADQTNLLALNAAIEAARAGEHGRGFAVVAEEVRALASRTQGSTEEIHGMIDRLQSRSTAAVAAMQRAHDQVDHSTQAMSETEAALGEIAHGVSGINDLNFQIASAAEQQSAVAEEINRNVQTISQISEESAQGATQTKTASAELARLAEELQSRIAGFRL